MAGSNGIEIVSTAADGTQGDNDSGAYNGGAFYTGTDSFSVSADGTKIAFMSDADNLVPGDGNGLTDIFVKDLTTGAITLASTVTGADAGRSLNPSLSPDGTKVAFTTTHFVNGAPFGAAQIFIKDLVSGALTLVVPDIGGRPAGLPTFSPDGTKLAFFSSADLTGIDTGRAGGLYVENLATGAVTLVSVSASGVAGNSAGSEPTFSPDGTKIAFTSSSTNLLPTPRTGQYNDTDVYVKDLVTGAVTLVSADASGQRGATEFGTLSQSANPAFSPDGTKVAFQSNADTLVPGDQGGGADIFIKDLATGAITRITTLADGTAEGGYGPAFSPDGTKIAFWSSVHGYTSPPHAQGSNIYVKDLLTGAFTLVSDSVDPANPGVGDSYDPQFSRDGSKIIFWSSNASLVANDTNGTTSDIFVKTLSSAPADSAPVAAGDSYTTRQGVPLAIPAVSGVLANDTDSNGDVLTASRTGGPAHGALVFNADGSFTYTPNAGYVGADSFIYTASDGTLTSAATTVSLTVAADKPPVAADDSYSVRQDHALATTAISGVLANDADPDGDALKATLKSDVSHGSLALDADGSFTYTPNVGYVGADSFIYTASDGTLTSAATTVSLTVAAHKPPVAADDSYAVSNASPSLDFTVDAASGLLANDSSPDGGLVVLGGVVDGVVKSGFVTAAGGHVNVFSDGRLAYEQPFRVDSDGNLIRYDGVDSFTYRVSDADGSTADATVTLTVGSGVNHPVVNGDGAANTLTGDDAGDQINGLGGDDTITGGAGADTIDGGPGFDSMAGGKGDDTYFISGGGDVVVEAAGGGVDTVYTTASWTVTPGSEIETLVATGSGALYLTGNAHAMEIDGNAAVNKLNDGGGADTLAGGGGSDVYVVHNALTQVVEAPGAGYDSVRTDLSSYSLPANVESLTFVGSGNFSGFGNAQGDLIVGGAGDDYLDGGANTDGKADRLVGGAGDDIYVVHSAQDYVVELPGGGSDTVMTTANVGVAAPNVEALDFIGAGDFTGFANATGVSLSGGAGNDHLYGGAGADRLVGLGGSDVLTGKGGADTFVLGGGGGGAGGGVDRVTDFHTGEDHVAFGQIVTKVLFATDTFNSATAGGGPGADYLFYDQASGRLYDEGSTFAVSGGHPVGGTATLIATFDAHPPLSTGDFII